MVVFVLHVSLCILLHTLEAKRENLLMPERSGIHRFFSPTCLKIILLSCYVPLVTWSYNQRWGTRLHYILLASLPGFNKKRLQIYPRARPQETQTEENVLLRSYKEEVVVGDMAGLQQSLVSCMPCAWLKSLLSLHVPKEQAKQMTTSKPSIVIVVSFVVVCCSKWISVFLRPEI